MPACSALVSWYSSTSTWSKRSRTLRQRGLRHQVVPVEQQVVVVEHVRAPAWPRRRRANSSRSSSAHVCAPREGRVEGVLDGALGVDGVRVDREAGAPCAGSALRACATGRARRAAGRCRSAASERSSTVKRRVEADRLGVQAQQAVGDRVEGAGPADLGRARPPRRRRPSVPQPRARCARARRVISAAARRVKVSSRIRRGSAPLRIRWATRCASVLVLPEPAPAMISSGPPPAAPASPPPCSTARRCAGLSSSRWVPAITAAPPPLPLRGLLGRGWLAWLRRCVPVDAARMGERQPSPSETRAKGPRLAPKPARGTTLPGGPGGEHDHAARVRAGVSRAPLGMGCSWSGPASLSNTWRPATCARATVAWTAARTRGAVCRTGGRRW